MSDLALHLARRLPGFTLEMTLRAPPGITVIFGDSGAGKSMTLRMVAGLERPDRGRVQLGARVLFDGDAGVCLPPQKRRVGFVFQQPSLFPHRTVRENLLLGGRALPPKARAERADALLGLLALSDLADRRPDRISGGQQQRAALGRALMQQPEALLLDEPFSALDLPNRRRMRECLAAIMRDQGIPVLLVTHDLVEALTLADTLAVVRAGRVVQQGSPSDLLSAPADPYVAALLSLENLQVPPRPEARDDRRPEGAPAR